ncbi:hypothetical protein EVAR_67156_1 [Eumeta japonica]|uniref:Uncharacterized protein n=1 Tax=Eumeta variegata TaxID=151549 RepID=A0A4C1ZMY1_EUMVA|nr:hypothetical protein EVAR_67156_1 [Eumeta japonica]
MHYSRLRENQTIFCNATHTRNHRELILTTLISRPSSPKQTNHYSIRAGGVRAGRPAPAAAPAGRSLPTNQINSPRLLSKTAPRRREVNAPVSMSSKRLSGGRRLLVTGGRRAFLTARSLPRMLHLDEEN